VAAASVSRDGFPVGTEGFVPPTNCMTLVTSDGAARRLRVDPTSPFSSAVLLDDPVMLSV